MSFGKFEYWMRLSLKKIFADAIEAAVPGLLLEMDGRRDAADADHEEWMALDIIKAKPERQRSGEWIGDLMLQLSIFSRFAEKRQDSKTDRASELASLVTPSLAQQVHLVKDYEAASPAEKGQFFLFEPEWNTIDERDIGQKGNAASVPSSIEGIALTFEGTANLF